jgi:MerT mercuric transport protein
LDATRTRRVNPLDESSQSPGKNALEKGQSTETHLRSGADDKDSMALVGSATGGLATAIAAVFAALCCVGPSTVALLGAGGALAAASLKPYRPFLLLASLAMILYGFWRAYGSSVRNRQGVACPTRIGRFTRKALWLAAIVWVAAVVLFRG